MEIKVNKDKQLLIAKPSGDIDHHSVKRIRSEIDRGIERSGARNVAFDFERVGFMDSAGIGMILGRYKKVSALGGKVYIFNASKAASRIIAISGLGNIARICGDWGEAE